MLAVDEMVASLVQELEAVGQLDDTFIFFTSDNGMSLGEHRRKSGKRLPYEELAHVPLFIRGPGLAAGSKVEKATRKETTRGVEEAIGQYSHLLTGRYEPRPLSTLSTTTGRRNSTTSKLTPTSWTTCTRAPTLPSLES
jgi:glucan phosphoethanolaminetransferase (alkaline phosphatase superfamily)